MGEGCRYVEMVIEVTMFRVGDTIVERVSSRARDYFAVRFAVEQGVIVRGQRHRALHPRFKVRHIHRHAHPAFTYGDDGCGDDYGDLDDGSSDGGDGGSILSTFLLS